MQIEMVSPEELKIPDWHTTYILRPDLLVLAESLGSSGFLSPVVVQKSTGNIIDGSQRVRLVLGNKHLKEIFSEVPVLYKDVSDTMAMVLHVQMNRGRGSIVAKRLSAIVRTLKKGRIFSVDDFNRMFAMKGDELELMLDGTILKHRKIKNHSYSRAWVPVEAPPGTVEQTNAVKTESPPNPDR